MDETNAEGKPAVRSSDIVGRSLPSSRFGAWIVNEVRGCHTRLVSGNLRHEKWMLTSRVMDMLNELDSPNNRI